MPMQVWESGQKKGLNDWNMCKLTILKNARG